jgi:hypothetical protein
MQRATSMIAKASSREDAAWESRLKVLRYPTGQAFGVILVECFLAPLQVIGKSTSAEIDGGGGNSGKGIVPD